MANELLKDEFIYQPFKASVDWLRDELDKVKNVLHAGFLRRSSRFSSLPAVTRIRSRKGLHQRSQMNRPTGTDTLYKATAARSHNLK